MQKLRDILDPLPDMQDTLLVWGSSFKINVTSADDPIQIAIENEIKANICKTPIGRISLEGQVQRPALSDTDQAIADMAAKLKERRDRKRGGEPNSSTLDANCGGMWASSASQGSGVQTEGTVGAGGRNTIVPALSGITMSPNSSMNAPHPAPPAPQGQSQRPSQYQPQQQGPQAPQAQYVDYSLPSNRESDKRDLAWFGGVHTDCNTIIYKAPLQGWNTLLPSSFAGSAPAGSQLGQRPQSTLVNKKF